MAKITWPSIGVAGAPYDGNITWLRTFLTAVASWAEKSPGAKAVIGTQISAVLNYLSITPTLPATQAIVSNAQTLTITDAAARSALATETVAANAITSSVLPGTSAIINSTVKFTAPAITGSYVNGYTLTIAAGVVTAIVAS